MKRNFEYRDNLVVKSNELIRDVQSELSTQEQHLLAYIFSFLKIEDGAFKPFEFSPHQYCEVKGISCKGANYTNIKKTIQNLADKSWWLRTEDETRESMLFRWISDAFCLKNGNIEIVLHPSLQPHLLALKGNYTKYKLENILLLNSKYSIRLYEILQSYRWMTGCHLSVSWLREMLGCKGHKTFKKFNAAVLRPAIDEINAYTDLRIDYTVIYEGKNASAVFFKIKDVDSLTLSNEEIDAWIQRRSDRFHGREKKVN